LSDTRRLVSDNFLLGFALWPKGSIFARVDALNAQEISSAVRLALEEDIGTGDVTTLATIPEAAIATAEMRAREPLVLAGLPLAEEAFRLPSSSISFKREAKDGDHVVTEKPFLTITGPTRALLTAERVALNFIQRLSGIATLTALFVEAVKGTRAQILDTRKTTPGWRRLEKYAVKCGGGTNHRIGLWDMVLIKDNHLVALRDEAPNAIAAAIARARSSAPGLKIEVETDALEQVDQALEARADLILLDNMNPVQLRLAVQKCKGKAQTEASGGVSLASVRAIAETGVDFISVGALTHSARAMDIGLDFRM
jgi:nicotinate-nucleotide pyrophosphorylase (carboxylating)